LEAHERDPHYGENESIDIGISPGLRKEGNDRINKVLVMKPDLAMIIENVHISGCFEIPEIYLHIAVNVCCIYYADTWSLKRVQ